MTGWISLFATELFQLSDRICRGPLTPIFCRIVLRVWIKKIQFYSLASAKYQPTPFFFLVFIYFFSLPTLCYYVAGKKTFSSKEIKHVQQPLLRYSTKNNLLEKIYRCHPCYVLEFGQLVVTNYKECNRQSNHQIYIIQFLSNIQSLFYLYHNYQKIDIHILLFTLDRGTSNRKGLKSSLYFISIILVPLHFSVMKINILLYLYILLFYYLDSVVSNLNNIPTKL